MARRDRNTQTTPETTTPDTAATEAADTTAQEAPVSETPTEAVEAEATPTEAPEAEATPTEAPEAPATEAPAEAEAEVDLTAFTEAVNAAVAERDTSTGEVPDGPKGQVTTAYRALDGLKAKNAARKLVNDSMRDAMNEMDIQLARAYMVLSDGLTAGSGGGGSAPKPPADPTEAFVQRLGVLYLAAELVSGNVPEGVEGNYGEKLDELLENSREQAAAYAAWLDREPVAEGEEDAPEPEASPIVKAAVKLSQGKSARVTAARSTSGGGGGGNSGPRGDIGKHLEEVFAAVEPGTFLTVADIRKVSTSQYPEGNPPSAGAISSRLHPKGGGKPNLPEGIIPDTGEKGNLGARKAA